MAATTLYIIKSTDGTTDLAIQARSLDGVDNTGFRGPNQTTDLQLPGNGRERWGEGFNQNFFRMLENFAIAEDENNPGNPRNSSHPDLNNDPSLGVNNPIVGQQWFNKTNGTMYVHTGSNNWEALQYSSGGADLVVGDITGLDSYIDARIGNKINKDGDSGLSGTFTFGTGHMSFNEGSGNVGVGPDIRFGNQGLLSASSNLRLHYDDDNNGSGILTAGKGSRSTAGYVEMFRIDNDGIIRALASNYETLISNTNSALTTKRYVDDLVTASTGSGGSAGVTSINGKTGVVTITASDLSDVRSNSQNDSRYVNVTGDTMSGHLSLPGDPASNNHAARKLYVDNIRDNLQGQITTLSSGGGGGIVLFSPGVTQTIPNSFTQWTTLTAPAQVPSGATGVLIGGINPVSVDYGGDSGDTYTEGRWNFRKNSSGTTVSGGSSSNSTVSFFGVGATSFTPVIVPITGSRTYQAQRTASGHSSGSLVVLGYIS